MEIAFALTFVALLLLWRAQIQTNRLLVTQIEQIRTTFIAARGYEYVSNELERHATFPNQIYGELADINQNQKELIALVRYLHSYVWEVLDNRLYEDIMLGEKSATWDKTFQAKEADEIVSKLWRRERDYDEGFHRAVSGVGDRRAEEITRLTEALKKSRD